MAMRWVPYIGLDGNELDVGKQRLLRTVTRIMKTVYSEQWAESRMQEVGKLKSG